MTSGEGDLRDAKLIELFKKNKMLNVQLERERTRTRTMRKTVTFIQEELRRREQVEVQEDKLVKMGVYYWVDKYQRTSTKLMEAQSKIGAMDTKIHKLMFALRREVGNHMPIDKVLEEGSGWVGRSEQISLLKHKVEELKSLCKDMMPTSKPVRHTTLHHDDRRTVEILHRNQIEKVDHDRRVQYDNLVHDFVRLTKAWGEQRDKLIASNARRSVLEKQIFKAKNTVAVLLSKSKNDDLLINALSIELGGMRQYLYVLRLLLFFYIGCLNWWERLLIHLIPTMVAQLTWNMLRITTSLLPNIINFIPSVTSRNGKLTSKARSFRLSRMLLNRTM
nr:coiled-coil domain-containing protein 13-like isoform X2 [Physcomitrium patens]|eukprot:XP_024388819.1 coiled-coil domain-containing protein 13-like isoform X2 [Physcomitrella patens]